MGDGYGIGKELLWMHTVTTQCLQSHKYVEVLGYKKKLRPL